MTGLQLTCHAVSATAARSLFASPHRSCFSRLRKPQTRRYHLCCCCCWWRWCTLRWTRCPVFPQQFTDHAISPSRHRLGPRQGDRQREQQNGPMDQESYTHQKKTTHVDEPRRRALPTSIYLWLLTVRRSDNWQTVVPTKAAAVAETSTN